MSGKIYKDEIKHILYVQNQFIIKIGNHIIYIHKIKLFSNFVIKNHSYMVKNTLKKV